MPDTTAIDRLKNGTSFSTALAIVGISLFLGISFDYLFYDEMPGLNFPIYILLTLCGLFAVLRFSQQSFDRRVLWTLVPVVFFGAIVFIRALGPLTAINMMASVLLLFFIATTIVTKRIGSQSIIEYVFIPTLPLHFVAPAAHTIAQVTPLAGDEKKKAQLSRILRGLLLAAPIMLVFLAMLSSADMIFGQYLSDIVTQLIEIETIGRSLLVALSALFFIGCYAFIALSKTISLPNFLNVPLKRDYRTEISIVLGCVNTLFLLFVLVQFAYFFGGEQYVAERGFTYAEYARSGFFELMAVAALSFLLIIIADWFSGKSASAHGLWFKCLAGGIVAETILIMVSASMRLSLYESAYGFTQQRLYSHLFIVFLAAVFILLLYKIVADNNERAFGLRALLVMILSVAALNLINPDAFVARQNVARFHETGRIDIPYLSELSSDATREIIPLLSVPDGPMRDSVINSLFVRHQEESRIERALGWQSRNWSREESISLIQEAVIAAGLQKEIQP